MAKYSAEEWAKMMEEQKYLLTSEKDHCPENGTEIHCRTGRCTAKMVIKVDFEWGMDKSIYSEMLKPWFTWHVNKKHKGEGVAVIVHKPDAWMDHTHAWHERTRHVVMYEVVKTKVKKEEKE